MYILHPTVHLQTCHLISTFQQIIYMYYFKEPMLIRQECVYLVTVIFQFATSLPMFIRMNHNASATLAYQLLPF